MRDWQGKTYWIVGASEGLGRAVAHALSRVGVNLVLSARSADRLEGLAAELPGRARAVAMDVTDADSVRRAAEQAGDIDGMIYLSGAYWPFGARDWHGEERTGQAVAMAEVNFVGALRTVGAVVGPMVARGHGHIVLTGSLAGFRGLPGAIGYCPSKAGIMSLAESMRADLRGSGVDVQLVNPGYVRTRLTDKNDFRMPAIMEPEDAARQIFEHMSGDAFRRSFPFWFSTIFRVGQFLPDWLYFRLFAPLRPDR